MMNHQRNPSAALAKSALEVRGVTKSFGAVKALRGVDLSVARGEILGLVGANGAGKSTLVRILTGDLAADDGSVAVGGNDVMLRSVRDAQRLGVGVVRQDLHLVPDLSIAENIYLAEEQPFTRHWVLNRRKQKDAARPLLASVGLAEVDPAALVAGLSIGDRQLVAAARAMRDAGVALLLDEPTSSLSPWEAERLFTTLRDLASNGVAIVYISHRLDEIGALCERVTVMRDGAICGEFQDPAECMDEIVEAMAPGFDAASHGDVERKPPDGPVVLAVRELTVGRHGPASFDVRRGEVLGIFGLVGAGRSTIGRALCGLIPPTSGEVELNGRPLAPRSAHEAFRRGIAYLSDDRKGESILPGLTVRVNLCVRTPEGTARRGLLRPAVMRSLTRSMIDRLAITPPRPGLEIDALSGGNQQKVVLSRLLVEDLDVVVLDEPTHGIDIAAKRDLVSALRDLAAGGLAVIFISSELPELLAVTDRVLVMARGRVVRSVLPSEATEFDLVGAAAHGGRVDNPAANATIVDSIG